MSLFNVLADVDCTKRVFIRLQIQIWSVLLKLWDYLFIDISPLYPGLNATTRAIDLVSKALSPLVVAQIMTFGSRLIGAIFIAVWNVVSVWLEYALLMRVYRLVPRLKFKENHDSGMLKLTLDNLGG